MAEKDVTIDRAELMKQGGEFTKCSKSRHQYYSERSQIRQPNGEYLCHHSESTSERASRIFSENIDSEVMVDFDRALQCNPQWLPDFAQPDPFELDRRET